MHTSLLTGLLFFIYACTEHCNAPHALKCRGGLHRAPDFGHFIEMVIEKGPLRVLESKNVSCSSRVVARHLGCHAWLQAPAPAEPDQAAFSQHLECSVADVAASAPEPDRPRLASGAAAHAGASAGATESPEELDGCVHVTAADVLDHREDRWAVVLA